MNLSLALRQRRIEKGLSQFALAHLAKVSLATVQNIEAGRGNPAWKTVQALLAILGLELKFATRRINWDHAAQLGCPLLANESSAPSGYVKSREVLLDCLENLAGHIAKQNSTSREGQALLAWLSAIRDHYPSLWRETSVPLQKWLERHIQKELSPKLRRLALSQLGEFL